MTLEGRFEPADKACQTVGQGDFLHGINLLGPPGIPWRSMRRQEAPGGTRRMIEKIRKKFRAIRNRHQFFGSAHETRSSGPCRAPAATRMKAPGCGGVIPVSIPQPVIVGSPPGSRGVELNPQPGTGCLGDLLQGPRRWRHPAALQTRHRRLRRLHPLGQLRLGHAGSRARLDQRAGQLELRSQLLIGFPIVRVPAPAFMQFVKRAHCITSLARRSANSISRRGVRGVFFTKARTTTTRRPVATT